MKLSLAPLCYPPRGVLARPRTDLTVVCSVPELMEYISRYMTLEKGDLILTGTPEGVGPVRPGDVIGASIPGVVDVKFPVASPTTREE